MTASAPESLFVIGAGRAGGAIAAAARAAGLQVSLVGRGDSLAAASEADVALLCVPDGELERAAQALADAGPPRFAGHVSGASTLRRLDALSDAGARVFSAHPLQTIPSPDADLRGAPCAIAGADDGALEVARSLASALGMTPFAVPEEARAAYHAAASIASNFLIALEESAAEVMAAAGVENAREVLAPLVLRSAANWADDGAAALTGPIARGDEETVAAHEAALAEHAPELLGMYRALAERTRAIANREPGR